jgi:alpha-acetolactate decarboxylase
MVHTNIDKIPLEIEGEIIYLDRNSAEGKALQRIQTLDPDDSSQFTTLIEEGQAVNITEGLKRLKKRGYPIEISDSDC